MTGFLHRISAFALVVGAVGVGCTARQPDDDHGKESSTRQALGVGLPFSFPRGQSLFSTPLYADSGLQVGASTTVIAHRGQVGNASGTVVLGANARLGDAAASNVVSVFSGGNVLLGANSRVTGFIQSAQGVERGSGAVVGLGVRPDAPLSPARVFTIEATFPTPSGAVIVGANQQATLAPGSAHTALTLGANATLHLSAGRYHFGNVTVGPQATLDVDDTSGNVILFVSGSLTWSGRSTFRRGPERFAIIRTGTGPTSIMQPFQGTILAPSSGITLGAGPPGFEGTYLGESVTVGAGTVVRHRPFEGWAELLCEKAIGPTLAQARSLPTVCSEPAKCCDVGLTRVTLTGEADSYEVPGPRTCVNASAGDDVVTGCKMAGSFVLGGEGKDDLQLGQGVVAYGGPGDDHIESFGNAALFGNDGDDVLIAHTGNNVIFPGPGKDRIETGSGDDTVILSDACEAISGKVIDLGSGQDTVISPLTRAELEARGVVLIGVEVVQVESDSCRSECRNPPTCVGGGSCSVQPDGALGCSCPPWAEGPTCATPRALPYTPKAPPILEGVDEPTRVLQARRFLSWFLDATVGEHNTATAALDGTRGNIPMRAAFVTAAGPLLASATTLPEEKLAAVQVLGYLQCRGCTEALIEAFPASVPNVPTADHGNDAKTHARAVQSSIARQLAQARSRRTKAFLLEHLARHTDAVVRRSIIFSLSQVYGESIRASVAAAARSEDMAAFDWLANDDPTFDIKFRARNR